MYIYIYIYEYYLLQPHGPTPTYKEHRSLGQQPHIRSRRMAVGYRS